MAEKIKVAFLGTGSAIPTSLRNHISVFVRYKGQNFLFDCGEGTQRQFRKAKLNPCRVNKIFVSHWHGDHVLGIPGLLQTMALSSYNGILEIHGPRGTKDRIKGILDLHMRSYLKRSVEDGNDFKIRAFDHDSGIIFEDDEIKISCVLLKHSPRSIGYSLEIKEKKRLDKEKLSKLKLPNSPLLSKLARGKTVTFKGKKIDGKKLIYTEPRRKISYIFDTGYDSSIEPFVLGSNLLMIESTYSLEEYEIAEKYGHLTSKEAAGIAKKAKVGKLALLHLSQRYDKNPKLIRDEAKKTFKGEILLPKDLDKLDL